MATHSRTDQDLLAAHRAGSAEAFAELAARHVHWIYSAARRRVGDAHLAEDVTQAVLTAMATNAPTGKEAAVARWLFGVLRHTAARAVRDRDRRRRREAAAAVDPTAATTDADPAWAELAPLLDDAVARLGRRDREAVLLRFYRQQTLAEVGAALGVSEDGARKRVARAVQRLHGYFAARGITTAEAALPGLLVAHTVQPAPTPLTVTRPQPPRTRSTPPRWGLAGVAAGGLVAVTAGAWWLTQPPPPSHAQAASARPTTVPAAGGDPTTRPTNVTLDQILAAIARTERQFTDVHVRNFEMVQSERKDEAATWTQTPIRFAGSAWYAADPRGPQRVYLTDRVLRWVNGSAPFVNDMVDLCWDGQAGVEMRLASQSGTRPWMRLRTASLTARMSPQFDTGVRLATGLGFTLQYGIGPFDVSGGLNPLGPRRPLSDNLRAFRSDPRCRMDVATERVNGFDAVCLRLTWTQGGGGFRWWFDPKQDFALVKLQENGSRPGVNWTEGFDVNDLAEASPGVWFPVRATAVIKGVGQGGSDVRYDYRAEAVTSNDPAYDPSMFRPSVPTGWLVTDARQKPPRDYVKMPDGSELEIHTGSTMPRVPAAEDRRPDGLGPAITRDRRAAW